jgi:hypothetical protein
LTVGFGIDNNSREDDNYRDDHSIRHINDSDDSSLLFTSAAASSGLYNEFELGTYALANPKSYSETSYYDLLSDAADSESGEHLSLVSGLLRIGPAAPAPLVGGWTAAGTCWRNRLSL